MWASRVSLTAPLSGQGGNRTPERRRRADLQSASFGHLDICPNQLTPLQCSIAEPTARIELATLRLQGGRSAAELRRRVHARHASRAITSSPLRRHYTIRVHFGQDARSVAADANCTRDRQGCQRSFLRIAAQADRLLPTDRLELRSSSKSAIANSLALWYTPAPHSAQAVLSHTPLDRARSAWDYSPQVLARVDSGGRHSKLLTGGSHHGCCLNEGTARNGRALRSPHQALESEDEAVHLHRAQWHPHHRSAANHRRAGRRLQYDPRYDRERRHGVVRRHQAPGAGHDRERSDPRRRAAHHLSLAGRHAHQLAHHPPAHRYADQPGRPP